MYLCYALLNSSTGSLWFDFTWGGRWNPPEQELESEGIIADALKGMRRHEKARGGGDGRGRLRFGISSWDLNSQMGSPNTRPPSSGWWDPDGWLTGQIVTDNWLGTFLGGWSHGGGTGDKREPAWDWQLQHSLPARRTRGCACCSARAPVARDKWRHVSAPLLC